MISTRRFLTCLAAILLLAGATAHAVPNLISYQGQLNDAGGQPVNGTVAFTFSIYDVPTGGAPLWTENQTLGVSNGVFSVQLGAVQPVPSSLFTPEALYLGIRAGADEEMTPRQRLTSAPYAHQAELAVPIGSILPWAKSIPGIPAISDGWVECNGQTLADAESPLNGQAIPDLNGTSGIPRFLRGGSTSGTYAGSSQHHHLWLDNDSYTSGGYDVETTNGGSSNTDQNYVFGAAGERINVGGSIPGDRYTAFGDSAPPYYQVVWIMRVK